MGHMDQLELKSLGSCTPAGHALRDLLSQSQPSHGGLALMQHHTLSNAARKVPTMVNLEHTEWLACHCQIRRKAARTNYQYAAFMVNLVSQGPLSPAPILSEFAGPELGEGR